MPPFTDNPFGILTTVVAPAVLTNACSVLCLGTANRIARVVDRSRAVAAELHALPGDSPYRARYQEQLIGLRQRARYLFWALRLLYASLGAFATAALVALVGAASVSVFEGWPAEFAAGVGLVIGAVGVAGIGAGCILMVSEVRLALQHIAEDAAEADIPLAGDRLPRETPQAPFDHTTGTHPRAD